MAPRCRCLHWANIPRPFLPLPLTIKQAELPTFRAPLRPTPSCPTLCARADANRGTLNLGNRRLHKELLKLMATSHSSPWGASAVPHGERGCRAQQHEGM